jgi:hypothetical protein
MIQNPFQNPPRGRGPTLQVWHNFRRDGERRSFLQNCGVPSLPGEDSNLD